MNILVLGGTRFFGVHMVNALLENGHDVTIATRGKASDYFGDKVRRIILDRSNIDSMKAKKRIIWIDDDINRLFLRPYIDEFEESGFDIIKVMEADEVDNILQNEITDTLTAIIIDISMPPGEKISFREARGGLRTGKIILERLLSDESVSNVTKIVFTNVEDPVVELYCMDNNIPYLKKENYFSNEFVDVIMALINKDK